MNLTYLANVKAYLGISTSNSDAQLARFITALSNMALSYMQRPAITLTTYNEYQSGVGNNIMMLRNWPIIAVTGIQISNASFAFGGNQFGSSGVASPPILIPQALSFGQAGYFLTPWDGSLPGRPQNVSLNGYGYPRGTNNILFTYKAGYCIQNELRNVPASTAYTLLPLVPNGPLSQDDGVTYANGTALTKVASNPAQGQYSFVQDPATGIATYTFAAADAGAAVLLSYSFIPSDLENAVIDMIGERFKYLSRIGETSHSIAGQVTVAFNTKPLTDFDMLSLNPYKKAFPI